MVEMVHFAFILDDKTVQYILSKFFSNKGSAMSIHRINSLTLYTNCFRDKL